MPPSLRTFTRPTALAALVLAASLSIGGSPAGAKAGAPTGGVRGTVVAASTGRPVGGATITLRELDRSATSGTDGTFSFANVPARMPYARVDAIVTAPGFGRWRIVGAPLYPGDTLIVSPRLRAEAYTDRVLTPRERAARGTTGPVAGGSATGNTCTGWDYQGVPPQTIWVWRHLTGVSEQYDFLFYAQHVLPKEWIPSWDADALAAGAIAVKTYSAYKAMSNHAYSGGVHCADVSDAVDGAFDPNYSTAATDLAVEAAFGSILYQNGGLFLSHYFAGANGDPCAAVTGQYAGWMSQWGTQTCGTSGVLWPAIVTTFYANTTWYHLKDLLLNPSASSEAMYAWQGDANTSFARVGGTGYEGAWLISMAPLIHNTTAALFQQRPFDGTATTAYHSEVALRCPSSNKRNCPVTLQVVAVQSGGNEVVRSIAVTVKHDDLWHLYDFDPAAFGVAHVEVRFAVLTRKPLDVDFATLNAPYGG
jgi:carboxypeptidase family protein/stage II sporulation SpoD-like protein